MVKPTYIYHIIKFMKKLITFLIIAASLVSCSKTELTPAVPTPARIAAAKDTVPIITIHSDTMSVYDARLNVTVFMQITDSAGHITIVAYCNSKDYAPAYIQTNTMNHGDKISFSPAGTINKFMYLSAEDTVTEIKLN